VPEIFQGYSLPPSFIGGGGGVKFLEIQFEEEGSRDKFPKEQGLGRFNLVKNVDFLGKLMATFNLV
jgi:hypothetical protein